MIHRKRSDALGKRSDVLPDLGLLVLLFLLPLLLFAPVALGSKTLLPADNLFLFEPYRTASADDSTGLSGVVGEGFPHNHLLSDLILQNYAWKHFLVEAIHARELPLWDPYIFAGHPFLANGQHSALYPLSLVFYLLPLWRAYGVFVWLQLGLAGAFAYLFARVLRVPRLGGLVAGITFQFSGFMIVSVVHPMIIAGASWLPFILAMVELVVRRGATLERGSATLPWALLGALGLGCQILAGHAENTYFVLLVTSLYVVYRLLSTLVRSARLAGGGKGGARGAWVDEARGVVRTALWLALMLALGLALGAVQFVPLYEVVATSFRGGEAAASLQQVRGWAYPWRRLLTFGVPNFFGNPAHHGYFDLFAGRRVPALTFPDGQYIDWGIKNYVEGGAYLGLLPLFLAAIAVLAWLKSYVLPLASRAVWFKSCASDLAFDARPCARHSIPFFTLLALFSLGCVFGTPLYALVYALPLLKQSHSPFRWVFPLTLAVAILAGFGVKIVIETRKRPPSSSIQPPTSNLQHPTSNFLLLGTPFSLVALCAALAFWGGVVTLVGLVLSRLFFPAIEPLVARAFQSLALAPAAFPDHRAFYSYEFKWVALFGLLLTGTGIVLRVSRCPIYLRRRPVWEFLAVGLLVLDFVAFGKGFNPAVDPALLDYVPPVVEFLRQDDTLWRYATFTPPGTTKTMNANVGMFYELQTVDGYDSLFSRRYADYMALIEEQDELQYNRIASFSEWSSLDSPLTDLLDVKYVVTEVEIPNPKYQLVYRDDAVLVYENLAAMPRAFTLPASATVETDDLGAAVQSYDPRRYVILDAEGPILDVQTPRPATGDPQSVSRYTINEVEVDVRAREASWLVLADSYFPGWKAFVRPQGAGGEAEEQVVLYRVNGVFRGVLLEQAGVYTVRFKYSPDSVKIGGFVTFIAGMLVLFLTGLYVWRFFYREEDDASTVRRVAKNSLAPIVINLFNRGIEMAFAALMARILGPAGNGRYATAINIYLWFDIIANFGLDMYLVREVARDRAHARQLFFSTTILRVLLFVAVAPTLAGFLAGRQALGAPLADETVWAVVLLYLGLLPGSVANGLAALFRGYEKHEIPAAIQTVTTVVKVTLGALALVGGWGIMGLAGASILTNAATLVILALLARRVIWERVPWALGGANLPPAGGGDRGGADLPSAGGGDRGGANLPPASRGGSRGGEPPPCFAGGMEGGRAMLVASWPLMASLLLQALFTGANLLLLQRLQGDEVVGWYDAARKWVDALNIIPSFFTFAVFPVMSRQAAQDRSGLRRSYRLSVKLLTMAALPAAVLVTLLARVLVGLLSGQRFLPHGAEILQLLIWSILFGWTNSLTNYVLIALNRQRHVLLASGARVVFTIAANLIFVWRFSYMASAWIIIGGELLLVLLFYADLRRHLGPVAWGRTLGRPALAGLAAGGAAWAAASYSLPLALLAALIVYPGALVLLRALSPEEWALLVPLLPARLRSKVPH
jgi:O-antigen/teichoic acid export membrane protein